MADAQHAVLFMAYGGPRSLVDVEPYLLDVRGGRKPPPELVEEIRRRYALIGGRSPLLDITCAQAQALEARLNAACDGRRWRAYVGMRHWHPYIRDAVRQIAADGLREVVALCATPHYSPMSVGAYFQRLRQAQEEVGTSLSVAPVESYHDHPLFIQAIVQRVQAGLGGFSSEARGRVTVLFTAHSLPAALADQGDPYPCQVAETARLVASRLGLPPDRWQLCYQSAGAPNVPWLGPRMEDVVAGLAEAGKKEILVAPIGFVADHVEVLYDIDIACRQLAAARGTRLERTESLNTSPVFIEALADVVQRERERWLRQRTA